MTNTEHEEMDLDAQAMDEIGTFFDGETVDEPVADEEEEIETSDPVEDDEAQDVEVEEPNPEQAEAVETEPVDSELPKPYQNKTESEWYEMQKNANTKISQQGNEIHQMRKQLEEIQAQNKANSESLVRSADDELLSQYQKEDLDAISKVVERKLQEREQVKFQATQQEREAISKEHDGIWENLQTYNPQLFLTIKDSAMSTMQQDPANTYQKKGWLKQFIATQAQASIQNTTTTETPSKTGVKRRAVTVGSGVRASNKPSSKSVADMSAEEYMKYAIASGYKEEF
jgi:hypothetical protein